MTTLNNKNAFSLDKFMDLEELLQKQSMLVDNLQSELNGVSGTTSHKHDFMVGNGGSFLKHSKKASSLSKSKTIDKVLKLGPKQLASTVPIPSATKSSASNNDGGVQEEDPILKLLQMDQEEKSFNIFNNDAAPHEEVEDEEFDMNFLDFEPRPLRNLFDSISPPSPVQFQDNKVVTEQEEDDLMNIINTTIIENNTIEEDNTPEPVVTDEESSSVASSSSSTAMDDVQSRATALSAAFDKSVESQNKLINWDRKMGLKRCHCRTMVKTLKSRKKLRDALAELTGISTTEEQPKQQPERPSKKAKFS
jgi:hypothetical protein